MRALALPIDKGKGIALGVPGVPLPAMERTLPRLLLPHRPPASVQPAELLDLPAYKAGDLESALSQAFLRMDEVLVRPEHRQELQALRGEDAASKEGDR